MAIVRGPTHRLTFHLSLLCEAEKVFFIFIMLYIFPLNFLQAAERILKKAEQTHKQRVEVSLEIPLSGCKENHFYSLPVRQAEASIY